MHPPHEGWRGPAPLPGATAAVARSGFLGQLWQGAAPAPEFDPLAAAGMERSRSGPLTVAAWGERACDAGWLHDEALGLSIGIQGEVFNATDLARALDLSPATQLLPLLLEGWKRWGDALFGRIDGIFAMALNQPGRLTLYRDPSGLGSLYVYDAGGWHVSFSTDLDALLFLPGTERRLSRQSLHEFLRFLEIAAPNTFFEHVKALEPGRIHKWPSGPERHAAGRAADDGMPPDNFEKAVDHLDEYLKGSVRARLSAASAPAAFLSGGIDSALLCAMAADCHRDTTAITVGFDLPAFDESPTARRIAAHLGLRHEVLRFTRQDYLLAFDRFSARVEQPMADPAALATLLAFEHCRKHHDAVLDGTGADEAVGMMPPRHIRVAVSSSRLLPGLVRRGLAVATRVAPGLGGLTPVFDVEHPAETMIPWNGFSRSEITKLCDEEVSFSHTHFYKTYEREQGHGHFALYSALVNAVPCDRITQAVRLSGARILFPFCEIGTDRFLRNLPVEYRYRPAQPKRVLRGLLGRYVPIELWDGPKHGFNFPLDEFLSSDDFAMVRHHLGEARWRELGVMSPEGVVDYAERYVAGDKSITFRIWALIVLSAWLEHHGPLV
jgi:asparagine synthase (glutamine-hydrolysing)